PTFVDPKGDYQLPVEPSTEYQFPLLKKPYTCSTCEKVFQFNLKVHIRIHTGERPYSCKTCGKAFTNKAHLRYHAGVHTVRTQILEPEQKLFSCDTCGKKYTCRASLVIHMRTHTGEKPFSCETCGKNFTCSSNLKVHMRIHTGEKPYSCQTCGRAFSNQGHLRYHTKIHTGKAQNPVKKLHSCETCGKTYTSRASLVIHVRTHTGEKPFSCKMCGKRFSRSANCKIHMRIHTGEKPYCCKICEKSPTPLRELSVGAENVWKLASLPEVISFVEVFGFILGDVAIEAWLPVCTPSHHHQDIHNPFTLQWSHIGGRNGGVSCPRIRQQLTGGSGDQTADPSIIGRPTQPLEPLPLRLLIPKAGVRQISFIV
uniref:C2H2-type domain-containing protein n=1 Tax=Oryzias latipes TaxID=8090 RepID=A0A3B3H2V0_ORYLA